MFEYFEEKVSFDNYEVNFTSIGKIKYQAIINGLNPETKFSETQISNLIEVISKGGSDGKLKPSIRWHYVENKKSHDLLSEIQSFISLNGKPYVFMYLQFPEKGFWFRFRGFQKMEMSITQSDRGDTPKGVEILMNHPETLEIEDVAIEGGDLTDEKLSEIFELVKTLQTRPSQLNFITHFFYDPLIPTAQEFLNHNIDSEVEVAFNKDQHIRQSLDFQRISQKQRHKLTLEIFLFFLMLQPEPAQVLKMIKSIVENKNLDYSKPPLSKLRSIEEFISASRSFQEQAKIFKDPLHHLNFPLSPTPEIGEFLGISFSTSVILAEELLYDSSNISFLDNFVKMNIFQIQQFSRAMSEKQKSRNLN